MTVSLQHLIAEPGERESKKITSHPSECLITFLPGFSKAVKPLINFQEQITGVEPAFPAWEASVIPIDYICMFSV